MTEYYTRMKVQSGGVAVHSRNVDAAYIGGEASTKSNDLPSERSTAERLPDVLDSNNERIYKLLRR